MHVSLLKLPAYHQTMQPHLLKAASCEAPDAELHSLAVKELGSCKSDVTAAPPARSTLDLKGTVHPLNLGHLCGLLMSCVTAHVAALVQLQTALF